MKRGLSGKYTTTTIGNETVRAFVPDALPPKPPAVLGGKRAVLLEQALVACGRLDSIVTLLPDPNLFLFSYIRREAVLSSQIEGTQSSLSDLLLFEATDSPESMLDDVREVSNYVKALEHGVKRLSAGFPLSNRLIREIHEVLLASGRGAEKMPGQFRTSQNWIGGTRPGNAHFVPPPPAEIESCMADLERFFHQRGDGMATLSRAAMAHAQFETIHPFLDGNGRTGRLLISLMLFDGRVLSQPLLYLSLYLKQHRAEYYEQLDQVRLDGDWEAWLDFFLEGVQQTATQAVATAQRLLRLFQKSIQEARTLGRAAGAALRVLHTLESLPVATIGELARRADASQATTFRAIKALTELGIVTELTGRQRDRVFAYSEYLSILSEGGEPL